MEEAKAAVTKHKDALVWVDLEMSGLDVTKDHILEMACLITDGQLNLIAEVSLPVPPHLCSSICMTKSWSTRRDFIHLLFPTNLFPVRQDGRSGDPPIGRGARRHERLVQGPSRPKRSRAGVLRSFFSSSFGTGGRFDWPACS